MKWTMNINAEEYVGSGVSLDTRKKQAIPNAADIKGNTLHVHFIVDDFEWRLNIRVRNRKKEYNVVTVVNQYSALKCKSVLGKGNIS